MSSEEKKKAFNIGENWSPKSIIKYAESDVEYKIKVMLLGDSGVGKTSIIRRWAKDEFYHEHDITYGLDTEERVISVNGEIVHLVVTDTAGHDGFVTIRHTICKRANGCFFVFDLTNKDSLISIEKKWLPQLKEINNRSEVFLIGTKKDKENIVISEEEAERFRCKHNLRKYIKTSSLTGNGIDSIFQTICFYVLKNHRSEVRRKENVIYRMSFEDEYEPCIPAKRCGC